MGRRMLTPDEETRLAQLRSSLILTLEFIEEVEDFPIGPAMRAVIERAAAGKDLRTLRLMEPDIREMTLALSPAQRAALDERVRRAADVPRDPARDEMKREVEALLARGTIRSERERRRLEAYADQLVASGELDPAELDAIQRVLAQA